MSNQRFWTITAIRTRSLNRPSVSATGITTAFTFYRWFQKYTKCKKPYSSRLIPFQNVCWIKCFGVRVTIFSMNIKIIAFIRKLWFGAFAIPTSKLFRKAHFRPWERWLFTLFVLLRQSQTFQHTQGLSILFLNRDEMNGTLIRKTYVSYSIFH